MTGRDAGRLGLRVRPRARGRNVAKSSAWVGSAPRGGRSVRFRTATLFSSGRLGAEGDLPSAFCLAPLASNPDGVPYYARPARSDFVRLVELFLMLALDSQLWVSSD